MLLGKALMMVLAGYALGCFTAGYYLVRMSTGEDIRISGSGSAGARNVARTVGMRGASLTFLVDLTKGAVAVWIARSLGLDQWAVALVMLAVVLGHIWPAQLGFHGGKGVATGFGAAIAYDWRLVLILAVICGFSLVSLRQFTMSGLVAIAATPAVVIALGYPLSTVLIMSSTTLIILFAHRKNISTFFRELANNRRLREPKDASTIVER